MEEGGQKVQIASVQTLARRYHRLRQPKLVIWDECHHIAAKSWACIRQSLPKAYHIGLSATPARLDGTGLGNWFNTMVQGPSVAELIEQGWLSDYRLFAPSTVNLDNVQTRMGDFVISDLAKAVDKPSITGDAVQHYKRLAQGKRALVFAVSIEHSRHVVGKFREAGIPAEHVDGDTPKGLRDDAMNRFRTGKTMVLSNCELFGEGVDVKDLECVVLLRPTQSLGLYLQMVGRGLRPADGKKECVILDHAGNAMRHGLPDEEREWSLDSVRKKKDKDAGPRVKLCKKCFAAQKNTNQVCQYCGYKFEVEARKIQEKEGELVEVQANQDRRERMKQQGACRTVEELYQYGISKGFKHPRRWAQHVFQARQRKYLRSVGGP